MLESEEKLLFKLIKVALSKSTDFALPNAFNWDRLFYLSIKQGIPAIVLDGVGKCLVSGSIQNFEEQD